MKLDLQASIFSFLSFDKAGGGEDVVEGTFMQTLPAKKTKPKNVNRRGECARQESVVDWTFGKYLTRLSRSLNVKTR